MYNGVWWVAKLGQLLCAWLRMFFFRLVVMAADGLLMVRCARVVEVSGVELDSAHLSNPRVPSLAHLTPC